MKKFERKNGKGHIGRRLLVLLLCLCIVIPAASSVLLAVSAIDLSSPVKQAPVTPGDTDWSKENRPDAESVLGEGAMYLDEFLKQHPDANVHGISGASGGIRPLSVGNDGYPVPRGWFNVKVKIMGGDKDKNTYSLDTERHNPSANMLWNASYTDLNAFLTGWTMKLTSPNPAGADDWAGPKSGAMQWNEWGYVDEQAGFPEMRQMSNNLDYGINAAYVKDTRIYNVGTITANKAGTNQKFDYLWVSLDGEHLDDSVVVLPDDYVNERVTLSYTPREYKVSYEVRVDGTSIDQMTQEQREEIFASSLNGKEATVENVLAFVFNGSLPDRTAGQTSANEVSIPHPGYTARVTYYNGKGDTTGKEAFPDEWYNGAGQGPALGSDTVYMVVAEYICLEEPNILNWSGTYTWIYYTEIDDTQGPSRQSFDESYSMGDIGVANGDVRVLVDITTNDQTQSFDWSTVKKGNPSLKNNPKEDDTVERVWFPSTFDTMYNHGSASNTSVTGALEHHEQKNPDEHYRGDPLYKDDHYTWTWTLVRSKTNHGNRWGSRPTQSYPKELTVLASLGINEVDITIPSLTDLSVNSKTGVDYGYWSDSKSEKTELEDEDGNVYGYVTVTLLWEDEYRRTGKGVADTNDDWATRTYTYTVDVTLYDDTHNIVVTDYQEEGKTKISLGRLIVRTAEGVDVDLRRAGWFNTETSDKGWRSVPQGKNMRFGFTNIYTGFHFVDSGDKRLSSEGYNVEFKLKNGYALPGMKKDGTIPGSQKTDPNYPGKVQVGTYTRTVGKKQNEVTPLEFTFIKSPADPSYVWYGTRLGKELKPTKLLYRKAYLDITATPLTYTIQYRAGITDGGAKIDPINNVRDGWGDKGFALFQLNPDTMPYSGDNNMDTSTYKQKKGYDFIRIAGNTPTDEGDPYAARFLYWVLTDAEGHAVDWNGNDITSQKDEWITFDSAEAIQITTGSKISNFVKKSCAGGIYEDGQVYSTDEEAASHGAYSFQQKYVVYLTAYWKEPDSIYTQYISANTRADVDGDLHKWFAGDVYDMLTGKPDETYDKTAGNKELQPGDEKKAEDGGISRVRALSQLRTILNQADLLGANNDPPVTVDKDHMIAYMGALANIAQNKGKHFEWYTLDDSQNHYYYWPSVPDKEILPIWFLDTAGSLTFVNSIDGYKHPNGVPYLITFTLPSYLDMDAVTKLPSQAMPIDTDGDGFSDAYDFNDYRYTAVVEHNYLLNVDIEFDTGSAILSNNSTNEKNIRDARVVDANRYVDNIGKSIYQDKDGNYKLKMTQVPQTTQTIKYGSVRNGTYAEQAYTPYVYTAVVYMKDGESITFPTLPAGTKYRVELLYTDTANRESYDGYAMTAFVKDEAASDTRWKDTEYEDDHTETYKAFTVKTVAGDSIGSTPTIAYGESETNIVAYDEQVINITSMGTYTLYLDQAKYAIETDGTDTDNPGDMEKTPGRDEFYEENDWEVDESWRPSNNDTFEVQNFHYLSYKTTARNLTNTPQNLKIVFKVVTDIGDYEDIEEVAKRRLAVAMINSVKIADKADDIEAAADGDQEDVPSVVAEGDDGLTRDENDIISWQNKAGDDWTEKWDYDLKEGVVTYVVKNVQPGAKIALRVRTTVPAVNVHTEYKADADLYLWTDDATPDTKVLESNKVEANVFSNWLRIIARIGKEGYEPKATEKDEEFTFKVTLEDRTETVDVNPRIHFMLFDNSGVYGTEHQLSEQWTARLLEPGESEDTLPPGEVALHQDPNDRDKFHFFVTLKHDQRAVIYDMTVDDVDSEDNDVLAGVEQSIKYTVDWLPDDRGTTDPKDDQNSIFSAYSYGVNGFLDDGVTEDRTTNSPNHTYSGNIQDGVDMVVYSFMPSTDLTIGKDVDTTMSEDYTRLWEFTITLKNESLEALYDRYDIVYEGTDWSEDQKPKAEDWKMDEDGNLTFTIKIKHGQRFMIEGLPQGTVYTIKESGVKLDGEDAAPSFSASYVETNGYGEQDSKPADNKTVTGSINVYNKGTDTDGNEIDTDVKATNKVIITNSMSGDLTIEKVVPGYVSEGGKTDKTSFTFEVTLTGDDAALAKIPGAEKQSDGVYIVTVTISSGEKNDAGEWRGSTVIKSLPNGTKYEVKEIGYGSDYLPTYVGETGNVVSGENKTTVTNNKTGTLTIEKEVTGKTGKTDTGSRTDKFTFTIALTGVSGDVTAIGGGGLDIEDGKLTPKGDGTYEVQLSHGQSVTIVGLPAGTTYTIIESGADTYETEITGSDEKDGKTATGIVALWSQNGGTTVKYINSREGTTPGGVMLEFLWTIPLFLLAIGGMTAILIKRRRRAAV